MTRARVLLAAMTIGACLSGCGGEEPRTREQLFEAERELPTLFMGAKTGKRVIAPDSENVVYLAETDEMCWKAQACHNPDCSGRSAQGEPYLFVTPAAGAYRKGDGSIGSHKALADSPKPAGPHVSTTGRCPMCNDARFVKQYELPETMEKRKALEEERRKRAALDFPQEQ